VQTKLPLLPMARELLTGRKILLVEDHDDFLSLLTRFLSRYGALVTACASISAAIDSVTRARPDLVITDIRLSDGDGFQLLRVIKKLDLESGTNTPVLAMSAHADLILGQRVADAGFSNFLRKPFTPDRLIEAINDALGLDQEAP
jgi:CheY-like chemotaxis protein